MKKSIDIYSMNILIIDDSANSSILLKAILKDYKNIFPITCYDAAESLLEKENIDLILLSYVLPNMSGTEACRCISERYEDIPIIMVTANSGIETLQSSFENGAIDYIAKPLKGPELISRVQAHLIRKDISDKRKKIAITDPLTQIYNRRHFDTIFEHFYSRATSESKRLSFFMIDIDNFKKYNDNYGHQKGDDALKKVASTLEEQLHRTDDYLFRLGGEEFAILLYDTPDEFLHILSDSIHQAIRTLNIKHEYNEDFGYLSISLGVATTVCRQEVSKFMIYNAADAELYKSKEGGRSRTSFTEL